MPYAKKVHRFSDCVNAFPYTDMQVTQDLRRVTCGACKRRILEVIARKDWNNMSPTLRGELNWIAEDLAGEGIPF